jgi:hypothetical protein
LKIHRFCAAQLSEAATVRKACTSLRELARRRADDPPMIFDHQARRRSYEIVMEAFDES